MTVIHKFLSVTAKVAEYFDALLGKGEMPKFEKVRTETEGYDHGEMQAPLSQLRVIESIMQMIDAKRVLEVGTFRGNTAARIAAALPTDGMLVTLEKDLRYIDELNKRWSDLGVREKIDFRIGKALETLDALASEGNLFDLAFIDADKENYKTYVEKVMKIMRPRGVILVDNTLWGGLVADESGDEPARRITKNIQEFNQWVFDTFGTRASIIPAWDGLTIIVKE